MASDITLSSAVRSNLLSLQNTADLLSRTQERLATGKKVNSALDNPSNFFTASALSARSGDLSKLLDSISNSVQALKAADTGISSLTKLVESAKATANSALSSAAAYTSKPAVTSAEIGAKATSLTGISNTVTGTKGGLKLTDKLGAEGIVKISTGAGGADQATQIEVTADTTIGDVIDSINAVAGLSARLTDTGALEVTAADGTGVQIETIAKTPVPDIVTSTGTVSFNALQDLATGSAEKLSSITLGDTDDGIQDGAKFSFKFNGVDYSITSTAAETGVSTTDNQNFTVKSADKASFIQALRSITGLTVDDSVADKLTITAGEGDSADFNFTNINVNAGTAGKDTVSFLARTEYAEAAGDTLSITYGNKFSEVKTYTYDAASANDGTDGTFSNAEGLAAAINADKTTTGVEAVADDFGNVTLQFDGDTDGDPTNGDEIAGVDVGGSMQSLLGLASKLGGGVPPAPTALELTGTAAADFTALVTDASKIELFDSTGTSKGELLFGATKDFKDVATFVSAFNAEFGDDGYSAADDGTGIITISDKNGLGFSLQGDEVIDGLKLDAYSIAPDPLDPGTVQDVSDLLSTVGIKDSVANNLYGKSITVTTGKGTNDERTATVKFGTGTGEINSLDALNKALQDAGVAVEGVVTSKGELRLQSTNAAAGQTFEVTGSAVGNEGTVAGVIATAGPFGEVGASTVKGSSPAIFGGPGDATRKSYVKDFNDMLVQINDLAADSSYNGINLLFGDDLQVLFNENGSSNLDIKGVTFDAEGLGLSEISESDFRDSNSANKVIEKLNNALNTLRSQASKFGSNLSIVQTRQDFTKNLINVLDTGAANLTLADTNEEGANALALQTRQQLSTTALSLSSQADQAVLRLF